ncbi:hypothetical protein [Leptospira bouyouniensis]|nr:hypothetical protein [Leptospira bouyouniensis]
MKTNLRIEFRELMDRASNADPMESSSEQYNFYSRRERFFICRQA